MKNHNFNYGLFVCTGCHLSKQFLARYGGEECTPEKYFTNDYFHWVKELRDRFHYNSAMETVVRETWAYRIIQGQGHSDFLSQQNKLRELLWLHHGHDAYLAREDDLEEYICSKCNLDYASAPIEQLVDAFEAKEGSFCALHPAAFDYDCHFCEMVIAARKGFTFESYAKYIADQKLHTQVTRMRVGQLVLLPNRKVTDF